MWWCIAADATFLSEEYRVRWSMEIRRSLYKSKRNGLIEFSRIRILGSKNCHCHCHYWTQFSLNSSKLISTFNTFFKTAQNQDNAELFVNCLEAMVETCLPGDDLDVQNPYPSSLGIASNLNLSSSMSSLSMGSLHSPTGGYSQTEIEVHLASKTSQFVANMFWKIKMWIRKKFVY